MGAQAKLFPLLEFRPNKLGEKMRPFIVIGDQTDHGGVVIGSTMTTDTHGKRLARVGDQVTCPKKGHGTTVIVTGDPTMIVDGAPVARHGDKCACGATLISSQAVSGIGAGGAAGASPAGRQAAASAQTASAGPTMSGTQDHDFDQQFHLVDEASGSPIKGRKYRITWPGGTTEGVSDAEGLTQRVSWHEPAEVKIELVA
jgi:uncharacterized Zn-binding protein involved in type VI secretion